MEIFNDGLQNYEELYNFFSSHQFTSFSKAKFIDYMRCLFDNNPFGKGLQIVTKNYYDEMIGYNSIFSVPFIYNNIPICGGQNVNLLVHSNFRKKGLFFILYKGGFPSNL